MDRVQEKETPLPIDFVDESIHGNWDESQLREVFVNLLANAIDAGPAKSPVRISTELVDREGRPTAIEEVARRDARARIVIADEGSGMDQKTQARLFEPFFTTKKRGTVDVQSTVGKGTTFKIDLPLKSSG